MESDSLDRRDYKYFYLLFDGTEGVEENESLGNHIALFGHDLLGSPHLFACFVDGRCIIFSIFR